jgi:hypothetical protein
MRTSLVKRLTPKTPKAEEFVAKYGRTFIIERIGTEFMEIRSAMTKESLKLDVIDGGVPCIDGVAVELN